MEKLAKNLWIFDGTSVQFLGLPFSTRMTIVKLSSGKLWVHSPIQLSEPIKHQVDGLGEVAYLIAPNHLHHFEVNVVWTPQDSGFLRVSIDDEVVVNFSGPTSYLDCVGPYFKTGIYRDATPNTFVMFVDDYSRKVSK